jgi:hypothetical protein
MFATYVRTVWLGVADRRPVNAPSFGSVFVWGVPVCDVCVWADPALVCEESHLDLFFSAARVEPRHGVADHTPEYSEYK